MAPEEVEIDAELHARATRIAAANGETVEEVVARLLREYVDSSASGQES
jgi:Arc/MetJ family transcription regulator